MAKQNINVGTAANDKKGDSLRAAFVKVNANFTELYTELGLINDVTLSLGAFEFTGSTLSTTDSTAIVIDQAVTVSSNLSVGGDIVPQTANGGDLGSSTLPWRSLYVSNNTIFLGGTAVGLDANGQLTTGGTVVGSTPAWNSITGKPTIPTSFDRLVNGAHELVLNVSGETPYVTFPVVGGGSIIIQGSEISADGSGAASIATLSSAESNVRLSANAAGTRKNWTFGTDGSLQIPGDIRSEGNINIEINLSDSTKRIWQFGEDGALTFPDGTNQTTAYTSVYAQSGATSAYATQRVLQYNPSTNAVTYSNYIDATSIYITGYSSEIHVSPVAYDDSGKGTIGDPVKTIARAQALAALAFETTGAGQRKSIILHPGDYVENVTISTQYTVLTTHELVGKNTTLSGTLTITTGCTIDGLKMTNLVISATSATGSVDIIGCTVTTATTKTSTAYTVFRGCDLSTSTMSITGDGTTALIGGNYFTLAVNNASAAVLAKAVITMGPVTLTAGTLQLSDTLIYSATNTSYAITQSAGSVITINNCQTLRPTLDNVSRISLNGFYSILSAVYDKPNSILVALSGTGGSLSSIIYDQYINADRLILASGGQITFPDASVQTKAWAGIPGPYADDAAAATASVAVGYPYHKTGTGGQVFVRLA